MQCFSFAVNTQLGCDLYVLELDKINMVNELLCVKFGWGLYH